jgi:hypothetical protein
MELALETISIIRVAFTSGYAAVVNLITTCLAPTPKQKAPDYRSGAFIKAIKDSYGNNPQPID